MNNLWTETRGDTFAEKFVVLADGAANHHILNTPWLSVEQAVSIAFALERARVAHDNERFVCEHAADLPHSEYCWPMDREFVMPKPERCFETPGVHAEGCKP